MTVETDDREFIKRLVGFGLNEKEAQLYLLLLKYGPKSSSLLAKSLKTYREDVYRTLTSLMDKGMVNPSIESPTVYTAVDLDVALEIAIKKLETELREMEMKKQELQNLLKQQRFSPSDEFPTHKILKNVRGVFLYIIRVFNTATKNIALILPAYALTIGSQLSDPDNVRKASQRGVSVRFITDISHTNLDAAREYADLYAAFGYELRHYGQYHGLFFLVMDDSESLTSINVDVKRYSLDEPVTMFWTDDPTYAKYLLPTFEFLWEKSVPAAQRIEELLKEGSPDV